MRELTDTEKQLVQLSKALKTGKSKEELQKKLVRDGMPKDHAWGMVNLASRLVAPAEGWPRT